MSDLEFVKNWSLYFEDETTVHDDSGEYSIASITTTAVPFLKKAWITLNMGRNKWLSYP